MKRKAEILAEASCLDTNTLAFKFEVQIIRPSEAFEAMEEYATGQTAKWKELYEAQKELLIIKESFRTSLTHDQFYASVLVGDKLYQKISDLEKQLKLK